MSGKCQAGSARKEGKSALLSSKVGKQKKNRSKKKTGKQEPSEKQKIAKGGKAR